jgi:hypothetical protein
VATYQHHLELDADLLVAVFLDDSGTCAVWVETQTGPGDYPNLQLA